MTVKISRDLTRTLTRNEIELARSVFGNAIDYTRVRLVHGKWWPFHPKGAAMAPMGNIYFHPDSGGWSEDFAKEPFRRQGFFIHEMTHVWQAQTKGRFYLPLMRHPFCRYNYVFKQGRPFSHYGLEQQAEIACHAFMLNHGVCPAGAAPLQRLEEIMASAPFATHP